MEEKSTNNQLFIPLAIVIAGIIIAGAIIFTGVTTENQPASITETEKQAAGEMRAVGAQDHILGDFNTAEVFVVEFSDLECPFCKSFHPTMKRIMELYGPRGNVAWVYRHFPLESIHPKAQKEAEASECAAELGGELKFWEYIDRLFEITPSNNKLDPALLPDVAAYIGLDKRAFEACLQSGRHAEKVKEDLQDALNSGARGTPHTIVITKGGKNALPIYGAQSFDTVRDTIEKLLVKNR